MKTSHNILFLALAVMLGAGAARAADDISSVIARARAAVGSEEALTGLKSVHYFGTMETTGEGDSAGKPLSFKIELIFQKPYQQRIVITTDRKIEMTCLDDYEAWQRQQDTKEKQNWLVALLEPSQVRSLRANTWENISFYRGIEACGGRVEDRGTADVDGVKCRKLAYIHNDDLFFIRYFAADTGKLILTETNQSSKIRETGEIRAGGLRFAKQIVTTYPVQGGPDRVVTITFDRITVNEDFPASLFQVPPPTSQ